MEVATPKISVIVPVYKAEQYLPKCIDSILSQIFTDFELLLIDDGSPDNSGKICDEYAEKDCRIRVFHKENGGVSSARNMGLDKATGEWLCFVDSDDWVDKEAFQDIISSIEDKKVELVIWGIKSVNPNYSNNQSVPIAGFFDKKTEVDELLIRSDMKGLLGSPSNKLYSRMLIKMNTLRFDTNLSFMEDSKFNWNYLEYVSSVIAMQKSYYYYRQGHNIMSLSTDYPDNLIEIKKESINMRLRFLSLYSGIYRDQYNLFLDKEMEMSHLFSVLALYNKKVSAQKRREGFKSLLGKGKIDVFQGAFIYTLLKTNNVFFIDTVFKIRYLICKYIPRLFVLFHKFC